MLPSHSRRRLGELLLLCVSILVANRSLAESGQSPQPLVISQDSEAYLLAGHARFLEDSSHEVTIEQILSGELNSRFRHHQGQIANFGFTGNSYWFEIVLNNQNEDQREWYLGVEYSLLDYIDLYFFDNEGQLIHRQTGDRREYGSREVKHRYFYFLMDLTPERDHRVYLRVQTEGAAEIPIVLKSPRFLAAVNHERQFGQGFFVGMMLIMIAYYLTLGLGAQKIEYLLYSFLVFSQLFFKSTMNGITHEYIWRDMIWLANISSAFSTPLIFFSFCLYGWFFLGLKNYLRLGLGLKLVIALLAAMTVSSFFLPYSTIKISTLIGLLSMIYLAVASFYIYFKGFKPALYFILSFTLLIAGSMLYGFQKLGLVPVSFLTVNCLEISAGLQAILLAVGQSSKINEINRAIRVAQKQALEAQIETNRVTELMKSKLEILVEERTADLWQKNQEVRVMMDNLQQGLCTIDDEMQIAGEYSKHLELILGRKDLAKRSLKDLLFDHLEINSDEEGQIAASIHSMIGESVLNFEANEHVFPRQVNANLNGETRILELEWVPILNQNQEVSKIMLTVRDNTEFIKIREQAAHREYELKLVGQVLKVNATKFQKFIRSSFHLITSCRNIIDSGDLSQHWDNVLRYVHTIKGNSRTYGFDEIARVVHEAEDYLFEVDRNSIDGDVLRRTCIELNKIESILDQYQVVNDVKLERSIISDTEKTLLEVNGLLRQLAEDGLLSKYQKNEKIAETISKVEMLTKETFRSAIQSVLDALPSLASQLGKKAPRITFTGNDFEIDKNSAEKFEDIFVHLTRNSIDHGFLVQVDGEIIIKTELVNDTWKIAYTDSGRGINLRKLHDRGIEKGLLGTEADRQSIANLVFHSGISSSDKVTDISGRGVGMDAVQDFIKQLNGEISIILVDGPAEPGFSQFQFLLKIPKADRRIFDLAS